MKQVTLTGEKKSLNGWHESAISLSDYLQVGDEVDEEMYWYFLEVLPPACMTNGVVQIGEASDHDSETGEARFSTLQYHSRVGGKHIYTGDHARCGRVELVQKEKAGIHGEGCNCHAFDNPDLGCPAYSRG